MEAADRVMNIADAHKLDKPERLQWMPPNEIVALLPLAAGAVVADIGAGIGFFVLFIAKVVAPAGRVFAVDMQPEMLELLRKKLSVSGTPSNVELVHGKADATTLPDHSCDLVFIANVWHELPDHAAALREFRRLLKSGGALAILDWRPDGPHPPGPPLEHRIAAAEVRRTLEAHGWKVQTETAAGKFSYFLCARPA